MFESILFYGIIIIGGLMLIGLTYYRIDWARHPEKYKDLVEQSEKEDQETARRRAARELEARNRKKLKKNRKL